MCKKCDNKITATAKAVIDRVNAIDLSQEQNIEELTSVCQAMAPYFNGLIDLGASEGEQRHELQIQEHTAIHMIIAIENGCHRVVMAEHTRITEIAENNEKTMTSDDFQTFLSGSQSDFEAFQRTVRVNNSLIIEKLLAAINPEEIRSVMGIYGDIRENHARQQHGHAGSPSDMIEELMKSIVGGDDNQGPVDANTDLNTIERAANQSEH